MAPQVQLYLKFTSEELEDGNRSCFLQTVPGAVEGRSLIATALNTALNTTDNVVTLSAAASPLKGRIMNTDLLTNEICDVMTT